MPSTAAFRVVVLGVSVAVAPLVAQTRALTLVEGDPAAAVRIAVLEWTSGQVQREVVLDQVLLREVQLNNRTANDAGELDRSRVLTLDGMTRIERPDCARLFVFERTAAAGHGLLLVKPDGTARIAYESAGQLDLPIAVGSDGRHVVFARGQVLTIVRLEGAPFAGGGMVRTVQSAEAIVATSLVAGASHAFFVTDDDRVHRCALAAGSPIDVTPATGASVRQSTALALSGDGATMAFLRGELTDQFAVWVVGTTGPAQRLPLPEREYREPEYLPTGNGQPHLLLNHNGTRVMVTELGIEDELHYVSTGVGGGSSWVTQDANFSDYIGSHILPAFAADRLLFASGHLGWRDWYAQQPDGSVLNISQTGSPETPFLVGALDVEGRFQLANGTSLATEAVGPQLSLRWLNPAGGTAVLFQDLVVAPQVGSATAGGPDLRIVGSTGQRLLRGTDGALQLAVPAGIELTDPVRGPQGWTAIWAHLPVGVGMLGVLLGDGTILLGPAGVGVPQLGWTLAGDLTVRWADRIEVYSVSGSRLVPLGTGPARIVSGAGG